MYAGSSLSGWDLLGSVDGVGRAHLLRLGTRGNLDPREEVPSASSSRGYAGVTTCGGYLSGSSIEMAPPASVSSRESGWAGIALRASAATDGGYGRVTAATALHFGKAVSVYQMDPGAGEGPTASSKPHQDASAAKSSSRGAGGGAQQPVRVFHTLGHPTALSWAGAVSGSPDVAVLAVAEESRVTLWDVRQVGLSGRFGRCALHLVIGRAGHIYDSSPCAILPLHSTQPSLEVCLYVCAPG